MLAGGAAGRDLIISLEQGSSFVQYLQPSGIFRFFSQSAPAVAEGEAGVFVGQAAVRHYSVMLQKELLFSDFSKVPQAALSNQFLIPRFKTGA